MQNLSTLSRILEKFSSMASTLGSYQHRQAEWNFQLDLANKELEQLDRQVAAAEPRISIVEKELDNHVLQLENAQATDAFLRSKYTSEELYQWQVGQVSDVFFQSY